MSEAIITVEGLGKRYRLGATRFGERYTALRDVISENVKGVFKKLKPGKLKARNGSWSEFSVSVVTSQLSARLCSMSLTHLKDQAAHLPSQEQRELIAYLIALQTSADQAFQAKLAAKSMTSTRRTGWN